MKDNHDLKLVAGVVGLLALVMPVANSITEWINSKLSVGIMKDNVRITKMQDEIDNGGETKLRHHCGFTETPYPQELQDNEYYDESEDDKMNNKKVVF